MRWAAQVLMPDRRMAWWPPAVSLGCRLIARFGVDLVYATTPPPSNVLVAWTLAALAGRPLVLDFRDPWCASNRRLRSRRLYKRLEPRLESRCVRAAHACVAVNDDIAGALDRLREPWQQPTRVIPNGFDPLDVSDAARSVESDRSVELAGTSPTFRIVHTGKVAFQEGLGVLTRFLDVCARWRADRPGIGLEAIFAGPCRVHETTGQGLPMRIGRFAPWARHLGVLSYRDSLCWQQRADALLLFSDKKQLARYDSIRSKCFEYASAGRPVLALVPPDSMAARFVQEHDIGVVADPGRPETIRACLDRLARGQARGARPDEPWLKQFDRRELTGQLADVMASALADKRNPCRRRYRRAS